VTGPSQPPDAVASAPPVPEQRIDDPRRPARVRRRWPWAVLSVLLLAASILVAASAVQAARSETGVRAVAMAYFRAVARGDAAGALSFAASPEPNDLLTKVVLSGQLALAPIQDLAVVGQSGTEVQVRYVLGFAGHPRAVQDSVQLVRRGSTYRLVRPAARIRLVTDARSALLSLAGRALPASAELFPGAVPVAGVLPTVAAAGDPMVRLADDGRSVPVLPTLTDEAESELTSALRTALGQCLAGSPPDPLCPVPGGGRPVPGSLRAPLPSALTLAPADLVLTPTGGMLEVTKRLTLKASWQVWDFNNQMRQRGGTVRLTVHAHSSLAAPDRIVWVAP